MMAIEQGKLIGWKEIASYLRVSVGSAQRFNRVRPMPLKRFFGRPTVEQPELDRWVDKCSGRERRKS
jgi:hypothetical protein